jgi:hypothetical protein
LAERLTCTSYQEEMSPNPLRDRTWQANLKLKVQEHGVRSSKSFKLNKMSVLFSILILAFHLLECK